MSPKPSYDATPKPVKTPPLRIAVLGLGRAGQALAVEFQAAGLEVVGLWNRSPRPLHEPLRQLPVHLGAAPPKELISEANVLLLAVHDSAIAEVAATLTPQPGTVLLHLSGALGPEALGPLAEGLEGGCYHPLQSFRSEHQPAFPVPAYYLAIDGPPQALAVARELADATGHSSILIPAEGRAAYHAAAVLTSGCMSALLGTAAEALALAGIPPEKRWSLLWPLAAGTLANLADGDFAAALTGPVARGDAATTKRNLQALTSFPEAAALYRSLGHAALHLAQEPGLDPDRQKATRDALNMTEEA